MDDNRQTVVGWVKESFNSLFTLALLLGAWLLGSAFPQPGQDVIEYVTPVVKEFVTDKVTGHYAPPPQFYMAVAPPHSSTNGVSFTGVF
jgi:hypothetical protein